MKILSFTRIIPLLLFLGLTAQPAQAAPLNVTVSIVPQKYVVEKIGGDAVHCTVMVQPGASPATYEPKPGQMSALSKSSIYFAIGVPFESAWLSRIAAANPSMKVVHMEKSIKKVPMAAHHHHEHGEDHDHGEHHDDHGAMNDHAEHHDHGEHHEHGEHAHGPLDPHVWTTPGLMRILAENTFNTLMKEDPVHVPVYIANMEKFTHEIDALDADLKAIFAPLPRPARFMVYHPAWGYFAREYGLIQVPVELEGKEPGPRELSNLIRMAKKDNIHVVFVQPQFSRRSAEVIAKAINGRVQPANPLAEDWEQNLRNVAKAFRSAAAQTKGARK